MMSSDISSLIQVMLHKIVTVAQVQPEPYSKLSFILLKRLALSYAGCDEDLVAFF